jgi:hypothetical protein
MKTLVKSIVYAAISLVATLCVNAQTNSTVTVTNASGGTTTVLNPADYTKMDQVIGILGGMTNWSVDPYLTYAPDAPTKFGAGLFAAYNFNQNAGLGVGIDWLGQFSLVSADVQLQLPFHPLPNQVPDLVISPFTIIGVGTPYSGDGKFNGSPAVINDYGLYVKYGHVLGGQFVAGATWGKWTGTGPYDVSRYHLFAGLEWGL